MKKDIKLGKHALTCSGDSTLRNSGLGGKMIISPTTKITTYRIITNERNYAIQKSRGDDTWYFVKGHYHDTLENAEIAKKELQMAADRESGPWRLLDEHDAIKTKSIIESESTPKI